MKLRKAKYNVDKKAAIARGLVKGIKSSISQMTSLIIENRESYSSLTAYKIKKLAASIRARKNTVWKLGFNPDLMLSDYTDGDFAIPSQKVKMMPKTGAGSIYKRSKNNPKLELIIDTREATK